jgi:hypothetical protein
LRLQPGWDVLIHSLCPCTFPFHCPSLCHRLQGREYLTRYGSREPTISLPLHPLLHVQNPARHGQVAAPSPRTVPEAQRCRTPSCPTPSSVVLQSEASTGVDVKRIVVRVSEESMTSPTNGSFITTTNRSARRPLRAIVTPVTTTRDSKKFAGLSTQDAALARVDHVADIRAPCWCSRSASVTMATPARCPQPFVHRTGQGEGATCTVGG